LEFLLLWHIWSRWGLSPILANITLGTTLSNLTQEVNKIFKQMEDAVTPTYAIFFVLIGASLILSSISAVLGLSVLYVFLRSFGKFRGVFIRGKLADADPVIQKNLDFCLGSQVRVTLGLSLVNLTEFLSLGTAGQELAMLRMRIINKMVRN
jgi:Kef-type K+ transport system membrane component KefB